MRISVITPTFNCAAGLDRTLRSVRLQSYPDVEHIVVDGGSSDETAALLASHHAGPWVSEPDTGLYDAINKGLAMATGSIVGVLGAGDFLARRETLSILTSPLKSSEITAVYSDVAFVRPTNTDRVVRYFSSASFRPGMFLNGYMPAHPTFYARLEMLRKLVGYRQDYRICGDYELLLRYMLIHNFRTEYVPGLAVVMETGGVSNASPLSRLHLNEEMVRACRDNNIQARLPQMAWKYPTKVREFVTPRLRQASEAPTKVDSSWMQ